MNTFLMVADFLNTILIGFYIENSISITIIYIYFRLRTNELSNYVG